MWPAPAPNLPHMRAPLPAAVALVSQANNKFDSLNQMLNIVQSIQLPFALIPVSRSLIAAGWSMGVRGQKGCHGHRCACGVLKGGQLPPPPA